MSGPLVECIPNFSEARRPQVVEQIAAAIQEVAEITILDRHSDHDHNRTVITFVGSPQAVEAAAFRMIQKAAELIDLNQHQGEHPRIGATDVVPFVPISGVSMQECVEMAQRVGTRVGDELGIPVYLYEEAATRPERTNLENIRRGQYEGLKEAIGRPEREPDFGPAQIGPAGATVIGARQPLIAYNVYLTTDEKGIADKIARTIRHSSGGLRFVKALGMLVEGRAQVSMNLTNFHRTPLAQVVEMIRREAVRYGVAVHHSELVGLIPQEALVDAAQWYLQLDQFERDQVLEQRLAAARAQKAAPETEEGPTEHLTTPVQMPDAGPAVAPDGVFLDALAAGTPTPGGGSAAAYSAADAAALVEMVARLTIGKKQYAEVEEQMETILGEAARLRDALSKDVILDAAAFESVMAAFRMPKSTADEKDVRLKAIDQATLKAAEAPLDVAERAVAVMALAAQVVAVGNLNAISDGATAAALARAALTGAGYNVRINVGSLHDATPGQPLVERIHQLEAQAAELEAQVRQHLSERGGLLLA